MSQTSNLFWDVSKRSLRCLCQWRSDWDLSKTSHAGWEGDITSNSNEIFEKYLWRILFLVKFQTYSLQFIQKINFSTGIVHEFCLLFSNIYLNEHLEWLLSFISIVRLHKGVYIPLENVTCYYWEYLNVKIIHSKLFQGGGVVEWVGRGVIYWMEYLFTSK